MSQLTFDEYMDFTDETAIYGESVRQAMREISLEQGQRLFRLFYVVSKLNGEAGELSEHLGKAIRDDYGAITPERYEAMLKELGDIQYYVARVAKELGGYTLGEVAEDNIDKLRSRKERGVLRGSGDNR